MAAPANQKRQHADGHPDAHLPHSSRNTIKKPRLSAHRNFPPVFWDRLSKTHLTRRALRELDRRNRLQSSPPPPTPTPKEEIFSGNLANFARSGGPDIADLRGCPPRPSAAAPESSETQSTELPSNSETAKTTQTSTSSRGPDFEQHLFDHGIYLDNDKSSALNEQHIRDNLRRRRPSLSLSNLSDGDFKAFKTLNAAVINRDDVLNDIVPVMRGTSNILSESNLSFTELRPMTHEITSKPKPGSFDGARPDEIDKRIRTDENICPLIIPTKHTHAPVAPNFFLEVRRQSSDLAVLTRQACFDGANGARAMHCLQNYGREEEPTYDGNAYAFSATYHPRMMMLTLYAHHLTAPTSPGRRQEYHLTLLRCYPMINGRAEFVDGLTALRNLRELAQQSRNDFIRAANARARNNVVDEIHISETE
ncbi:hypothetical protein F5Y14DRAFT_429109 [Nemania sp. NC0429]|nr:hypothetical protein F5Y14DRAFT_429109 [Nemania sp. NC0429]